MKNYSVSRMKQRVEFGQSEVTSTTVNGDDIESFVPNFSLWCGDYSLTINQSVNLLGLHVDTERMIVIRHNDNVNDKYLVKLSGVVYQVTSINSDTDVGAFDIIGLKRSQGIQDV
ncbi:phage head closure protein [Pediococcus argentinicus]|uniref:phage head closure protein n=1 Tax=Pediococcus argentinicus TaxID=480391 RepID=UPI00338E1D31